MDTLDRIVQVAILGMCLAIYIKARKIYECLKCDEQPPVSNEATHIELTLDEDNKK